MRVLIVEDHLANREVLAELLAAGGHAVATAASGPQALAAAAEFAPDAVVLDWLLPGMDGGEVLAALRRRRGGCPPVVVLTALSPGEMAAPPPGVSCVLHKPVDVDQVEAALARVAKGGRP